MQSKRKNVDKRKIFLWCAAAGIVLCAVLFCLWHNRTALAEQRVERALSVTVSQPEPRLAQEDNTETGAWITVPGTNIDAPVQQASDTTITCAATPRAMPMSTAAFLPTMRVI